MNSQNHNLSDEAFADLLARPSAETTSADREAEALRSALRSYRTETLQWAERRSSTSPSLQPAARRSRIWAAVPQWSLAAVAVISIAAGVAHVYDRPDVNDASEETVATAPAQSVVVPVARISPAEIAADNRLLSSIDQALSDHAVTPVEGLGLKPSRSVTVSGSGATE